MRAMRENFLLTTRRRAVRRDGGDVMRYFAAFAIALEYRFWRVNEYLAYMRGDRREAAECAVRAHDCLRYLDILSIQEEF